MKLENLFEGPHDRHTFKALFMAGSPGAGKSFFSDQLRRSTNLKYINVDSFVEFLMKQGKDYKDLYTGETYKKLSNLTLKRLELGLKGNLGLLIDSTGKDFEKYQSFFKRFQKLNYDVAMVYINTDLETAIYRNKIRKRQVPEAFLKLAHDQSKENLKAYARMFNPLFIIDNSLAHDMEEQEQLENYQHYVWKKIIGWLNKPPATVKEPVQEPLKVGIA